MRRETGAVEGGRAGLSRYVDGEDNVSDMGRLRTSYENIPSSHWLVVSTSPQQSASDTVRPHRAHKPELLASHRQSALLSPLTAVVPKTHHNPHTEFPVYQKTSQIHCDSQLPQNTRERCSGTYNEDESRHHYCTLKRLSISKVQISKVGNLFPLIYIKSVILFRWFILDLWT